MLCEDVLSRETIPAVPTSIVDGYAVISSDGVGEFDIVGGSRAGGAEAGVRHEAHHAPMGDPRGRGIEGLPCIGA